MAKILITGGTGFLGLKLKAPILNAGHELRIADVNGRDVPEAIEVDLSVWSPDLLGLFAGVDCVVHLAATPDPSASWSDVQRLNIDMTMNVFEAAVQSGVKRVIFASSNWVLAGHRFSNVPLNADTPPAPINAYGASKLMGERLGQMYSLAHGLSVICLRVGSCQRGHNNQPGPHMNFGVWGQQMWLSDQDFCSGVMAAIHASPQNLFSVIPLVSDNAGMRWDLTEAFRVTGYRPASSSTPVAGDDTAEAQPVLWI